MPPETQTRTESHADTQPDKGPVRLETKSLAKHALPMGVLDIVHVEESGDDSADLLLAACMDGVYQLNLKNGSYEKLYQHDSYCSGVVVARDRGVAVSAGYDGQLIWYDLSEGQWFRRIQAHDFWSWQLAISPDEKLVASATGQYLAGGDDYSPAAEKEPSVKIYDVENGRLVHELEHVPSVQSVAFSNNGRFVAAGNLLGETRVWSVETGSVVSQFKTDAFTSWGIIKSHCFIGGIHALTFSADDRHLILAGHGPMRDPMAGNGRQLWQRYDWQASSPTMVDETHGDDSGEGLMETLCWSPESDWFLMGGRQRGGDWNAAIFDTQSGRRVHHVSTGVRLTSSLMHPDGERLILAGCRKQKAPKDGVYPDFGQVEVMKVQRKQG